MQNPDLLHRQPEFMLEEWVSLSFPLFAGSLYFEGKVFFNFLITCIIIINEYDIFLIKEYATKISYGDSFLFYSCVQFASSYLLSMTYLFFYFIFLHLFQVSITGVPPWGSKYFGIKYEFSCPNSFLSFNLIPGQCFIEGIQPLRY